MFPPNRLPKPRVDAQPRAASKRNGILSTALVSKGELHMSAVGRNGTLLIMGRDFQGARLFETMNNT